MREYGFSVTCILPYNDTVYDFVLIRENTGHWKPVFLHILCSELSSNFFLAILKTRNTGTGNGMRGMRGTRGMFTTIPGNLLEGSGECSYFRIPENAREDSGECSRRFRGMFKKMKRKEISRPWENTKKEKLKSKTNIRRKWIKEIIAILYSCWK